MKQWKPKFEKLLDQLVKAISRGDGYIEKYFYVQEMILRAEEAADAVAEAEEAARQQELHELLDYDYSTNHEQEVHGYDNDEDNPSYSYNATEGEVGEESYNNNSSNNSHWYIDNGDEDENDFFIS